MTEHAPITRSDIDDFFRDKAYAYTKGQLRYVSLLFVTPCEFKVGSQIMHMQTARDVEHLFHTYRQNLIARDYDKTRAEVVHCAEAADGRVYCLVTYTNTAKSGDVISTEHASYFLDRANDGIYRIAVVEFVDEPKPHLFEGMTPLTPSPEGSV